MSYFFFRYFTFRDSYGLHIYCLMGFAPSGARGECSYVQYLESFLTLNDFCNVEVYIYRKHVRFEILKSSSYM